MKKALIGAGGFAREIAAHMKDSTIPFFVDDQYWEPNSSRVFPLSEFDPTVYEVIIAIGDPKSRLEIKERLPIETQYFTFIHSSAHLLGSDVSIGRGSIICAGTILTTNIKIGDHAHLNLQTTIGHDCEIGDYFTTAPGVKVSGNCKIGDCVYLGTNSSVKQETQITGFSTVGMNAAVVKDIVSPGTYIGVPAKKMIR